MFSFIKEKIKKVYSSFTKKVSSLFLRSRIDQDFMDELEALLLSADTGVTTTQNIIKQLTEHVEQNNIEKPDQIKEYLEKILCKLVLSPKQAMLDPRVLMMVGVNGTGKTTFVAKFANQLTQQSKKVLLVAGDTFRAAATEQLGEWGKRIGVEVFIGKDGQDPASVIFDSCTRFIDGGFDHLIIDTAGRLQTKVNLMKELEKMCKIINRKLPNEQIATWLSIDAMLGQNSLRQAEVFHEATSLDGIVLTKLDGTGKGGIVFAIVEKFALPITFATFGEQLKDIKQFDTPEYVQGLFNE